MRSLFVGAQAVRGHAQLARQVTRFDLQRLTPLPNTPTYIDIDDIHVVVRWILHAKFLNLPGDGKPLNGLLVMEGESSGYRLQKDLEVLPSPLCLDEPTDNGEVKP